MADDHHPSMIAAPATPFKAKTSLLVLSVLAGEASYGYRIIKRVNEEADGKFVWQEGALILVEKHFGDPAVVKGLMGQVHVVRVHVSLARRLAALVAADLLCLTLVI